MGYFWGRGRVQKLFWDLLIKTNNFCFQSIALFPLYHVVLSLWWWGVVGGGGGVPSDYLVATQLQLWLFCCWGCGCCWAVTISLQNNILLQSEFQEASKLSIMNSKLSYSCPSFCLLEYFLVRVSFVFDYQACLNLYFNFGHARLVTE